MLNRLKKISLNLYRQVIFHAIVITTVTTLLLHWTKVLKPFELLMYDLNFWLRPIESIDKHIVIIQWDEQSMESQKEIVISDSTLLNLLRKVQEQRPTIVGVDIYRDLPINSPKLTSKQNTQAQNRLEELFGTTNNLILIKKVIKPIIYAPKISESKNQVAASDVPVLSYDVITRQTYIYPQLNQKVNFPDVLYLGAKLGFDYLATEGFSIKKIIDKNHNGLVKISSSNNSITLVPQNLPLSNYQKNKNSFNLLVNWRKGKPAFDKVSATDVINDKIRADLFYNKIILIGNTSSLDEDKYYTSINRWDKSETYGVEIAAQVASSLINATVENRALITLAPKTIRLLTILASVGILTRIFYVYKDQGYRTIDFYLITFLYALFLTVILLVSNIFGLLAGFWIPITTATGNIWSLYFALNYYLYKEEERKRTSLFISFIEDLQHSIGNPLNSITSSTNRIETSLKQIKSSLIDNSHQELKEDIIQSLSTIHQRNTNIKKQKLRIENYQRRTNEFISFGYLNRTSPLEAVKINLFVSEVVARFIDEYEYEYQVNVEEIYDEKIEMAKIDKLAIEIVIENLLSNAFYSVSSAKNSNVNHIPSVKVTTKLKSKEIEFTIEDNGVGIPKYYQPKIFQPFISFSRRQGIGLYLVTKILSFYQGVIKVESELGQGAKFIFTIAWKKVKSMQQDTY